MPWNPVGAISSVQTKIYLMQYLFLDVIFLPLLENNNQENIIPMATIIRKNIENHFPLVFESNDIKKESYFAYLDHMNSCQPCPAELLVFFKNDSPDCKDI